MEKKKGLYLGTEIAEKWWRRYTKDNLLMRGNGDYWYDERGFYFLRDLTQEPIFIPYNVIQEIKLGTWHSGKWCLGNLVVKIVWKKDNVVLSSGFIISNKKEDKVNLKKILEDKIKV